MRWRAVFLVTVRRVALELFLFGPPLLSLPRLPSPAPPRYIPVPLAVIVLR